jgi:hypothetical protein
MVEMPLTASDGTVAVISRSACRLLVVHPYRPEHSNAPDKTQKLSQLRMATRDEDDHKVCDQYEEGDREQHGRASRRVDRLTHELSVPRLCRVERALREEGDASGAEASNSTPCPASTRGTALPRSGPTGLAADSARQSSDICGSRARGYRRCGDSAKAT